MYIYSDLLSYADTKGNLYISSMLNRELEFTQHQIFTLQCLYCFYSSQNRMYIAIGRDQQDEICLKSFDIINSRPVQKYKNTIQNNNVIFAQLSDSGRALLINTNNGVCIYKAPKFKLIASSQEHLYVNYKVIYAGFFQQYNGNLTLQPQNIDNAVTPVPDYTENASEVLENQISASSHIINAYKVINNAIKQQSADSTHKSQQDNVTGGKQDEQQLNITKNNILTVLLILQNPQNAVSIVLFSVNVHQQNQCCSRTIMEYQFLDDQSEQIPQNQIQFLNNSLVFNLKQNNVNTLTLMQIKSKDDIVSVNSIEKISDISFQPLNVNLNIDNIQSIQTNRKNELLIITNQYTYIYDLFKNRISLSEPNDKTIISVANNNEKRTYYLLTINLEILQLIPLNDQQIIKNLVDAYQFEEALEIAQANSGKESINTADIREQYAQYLLQQGQYTEATQQFKMIIGSGNTSLAIKALFDKNLIQHLISYLVTIHNKNMQTEHHTILLINLFAKSNDKQEAVSFIRGFEKDIFENSQSNSLLNISVSSNRMSVKKEYINNICEALIRSQFVNLSVEFAMISRNEELACDYLILYQRYEEVTMILHCLPYQKAHNILVKHGIALVNYSIQQDNTKYMEKIIQLIQDLCIDYVMYDLDGLNSFYNTLSQQIDISKDKMNQLTSSCSTLHDDQTKYEYFGLYKEQTKKYKYEQVKDESKLANIQSFIHLFGDEKSEHYLVFLLLKLFQTQISQNQTLKIQNQQNNTISHVQYLNDTTIELLFELLLKLQGKRFQMSETLDITSEFVTQTLQFLLNNIQLFPTVQLDHLTMLFKISGNNECIIKILEHRGELSECLELYCQNNDYQQAFTVFKRLLADEQQQICTGLIKHIAGAQDNEQLINEILEYLQNDAPFRADPVSIISVLVEANPNLNFSAVSSFVSSSIQQQEDEYNTYKDKNDQLLSQIRQTDDELKKLQQITVFNKDVCNKCNLPLDLPCICVGCGHKYHERCWKAIEQKCSCWDTHEQMNQDDMSYSEDNIFKEIIGNKELLAQFALDQID